MDRFLKTATSLYYIKFTDGWAAYLSLPDEGYAHYVVNHKWTFKCTYVNINDPTDTQEVHTNSREGEYQIGILDIDSATWFSIYIRYHLYGGCLWRVPMKHIGVSYFGYIFS